MPLIKYSRPSASITPTFFEGSEMTIDTDKCTEQFTMRIPEVLKLDLDKLSKKQKSDLVETILITMARAVHNARFNPEIYLKSNP